MEVTYHLNPGELNETFLQAMQLIFEHRRVKITVEVEEDETEAIRANPALREKLMRSLQQAEAGFVKEVK